MTYLKADLLFHEMRFAIKDFKEKEISDSFFFQSAHKSSHKVTYNRSLYYINVK